ncbi:hypothetical protein C6N75_27375, partial [Streptomyces solincola]
MDYCHSCRRHLNGALACAGCGTPAERLPGRAPAPPPAPDRTPVFELSQDEDLPAGGSRHGRERARRAARRARSRRGRKLATGAAGLLLAAGLLGLAELAVEGSGDDRAATAVEEQGGA